MDVDFLMNFKNFAPPAGKDSTKLDTVLKNGLTIKKNFDLDGYTFYNPQEADSVLKKFTLVITLTLISSLCYSSDWGSQEKTEEKLFSVEVMDSSAQTIKDSIDFSSTTEAFRRIEIKSEVMTTIEKVLVKAGSKVNKGQHIVELDDYKTNADLYKLNLLSQSEFD